MPTLHDLDEHELVHFLANHLSRLHKSEPLIVSIVGGPGSGKGVLSSDLAKALPEAGVLSTDSYMVGDRAYRKHLEVSDRDPADKYDFAFLREQVEAIRQLSDGQSIGVPKYEEASGVAINSTPHAKPTLNDYPTRLKAVKYLIIEGDFQPLPRDEIDCLIYLDVPDEVRLANRLHRDLREGREPSPEAIATSFTHRRSQFEKYTLPHKEGADIVVSVRATELRQPTTYRKFHYTFSVVAHKPRLSKSE
jgi:uridine kinase